MNIGLQDAHNLAWKIAFVLNKVAPESMLETYDEREAMADRAIALSSKLFTESREGGTIAFMKRRAYYLMAPPVLKFLIHIGFAPENSRTLVRISVIIFSSNHRGLGELLLTLSSICLLSF